MEKIKNLFRVTTTAIFGARYLKKGSKKLRKWLKKNEKEQDESLYDFNKRWEFSVKRTTKFLKKLGIEVIVEGKDNIPKGAFWMTPNHSSNFDGFYLTVGFGKKTQFAPVAKESLKDDKRANGYLLGADGFFLDRANVRQSIAALNNAAQYAKQTSRGIVVFPEGMRSLTSELLDFKAGTFKFPQKYFLPIVPVTICGTLQAKRWYELKKRKVIIKISPPIKPQQHIGLDSIKLADNVKKIIQNNLTKYENSLTSKEKERLESLKQKAVQKQSKLKNRFDEEMGLVNNEE